MPGTRREAEPNSAVGPEGESHAPAFFIGDYTAISVGADLRIHPCCTDFRGRPGVTPPNQDAYTQSISLLS